MRLRVAILLAVGLLASGCGPTIRYVYTPPASAEGRVCTSQCRNNLTQCVALQDARYQDCQRQHDAAMHNYSQCRDAGGRACRLPPSCFPPTRWECEESYRACYQNCGGHIEAIEEKR